MGINQTLPTTSYMKWIDLWMMFSIIMPFLEVLAQAGYYVLKGEWLETQPSALPTISPFPDSRSKVEPMDKPELATSIWSQKSEERFLCSKYQLLATLCHTQITLIAFRRLGLIGMKVTSTLVLPIGYLVFVIMW